MGTTEFTHGSSRLMMKYLNESTKYIFENFKKKGKK
jgi:hypothetical protein